MNPYQNRMLELEAQIVRKDDGVLPITLSEEEILVAESKFRQRLPEDYRLFLKHFGCFEIYASYRCKEMLRGWGTICLFYGITPSDSHPFPFDLTFDLLFNDRTFKRYLPEELIAIGDNGGKTLTCLALSGPERGTIYLWDRIASFDGNDYKGIHFVAPSFDAFMQMLRTEEQYEEASK